MWTKFNSHHPGIGTLVEVYIDEDAGLIKRTFSFDAVPSNGVKQSRFNPDQVKEFFDWEVYWLNKLDGSKWIPETVDVTDKSIIQCYYGPCLLDKIRDLPAGIVEQVIDMYDFFADNNMFKRNGSLSNLTMNGNQLVAFDFKWARPRPIGMDMEIRSYNEWLCKIDPTLTHILMDKLSENNI